jgi:hypothetical protein
LTLVSHYIWQRCFSPAGNFHPARHFPYPALFFTHAFFTCAFFTRAFFTRAFFHPHIFHPRIFSPTHFFTRTFFHPRSFSPVGYFHPPHIFFTHQPVPLHYTFDTMLEAKVNRACAPCTRVHRHCDRKNPCGGFTRLGLDCVPQAKVPCPTCRKMMTARRHTQTDGSEGQIGIHAPKETERDDVKDVVNKLGRFAWDPSFVRSLDDDQLQQMFRTWEAIIRKSINCEQATGKPP